MLAFTSEFSICNFSFLVVAFSSLEKVVSSFSVCCKAGLVVLNVSFACL